MKLLFALTLLLSFNLRAQTPVAPVAENEKRKKLAAELIEISEYKTIVDLYPEFAHSFASGKIRSQGCTKDAKCTAYWNQVEAKLLVGAPEFRQKVQAEVVAMLAGRYTSAQLEWLLNAHKTQLLQDFRKFYDSRESAKPFKMSSDFLKEQTRDIKPYGSIPVSGTSAATPAPAAKPVATPAPVTTTPAASPPPKK